MTNPLYTKLQATALALLGRFGSDATITSLAGVVRTVKAVRVKDVKHDLANSAVQIGDIQYLVESDGNPDFQERFKMAGQNLVIVWKEPIQPADVVLAWYVYGRNG